MQCIEQVIVTLQSMNFKLIDCYERLSLSWVELKAILTMISTKKIALTNLTAENLKQWKQRIRITKMQ